MKLSVIVPCYNEIKYIREIIIKIKHKNPSLDIEIIVIDDNSRDGTKSELNLLKNENKIDHLILNNKNMGKGFCIREGIKLCSGHAILIQDADLEYDPAEYKKLVMPIFNDQADVVYGSRFVGSESKRVLYFWHSVANYLLTLLSNMFTNINLTDMEVCYKAFKSDIIKQLTLEENRFGFEPEVTAKISKIKEIRIFEVGVSYFGRTFSEGKKISWKDGFSALRCILKYNLFK
jgi:glycosyltransferase involved in cell wall biosynthesis